MNMKPIEIVDALRNEYQRHECAFKLIEVDTDLLLAAANLIESIIPKPIEEAPRDGTDFIGIGNVFGIEGRGIFIIILNIRRDKWYEENGMNYDPEYLTHFIPLSSIQKLMEGDND